MSEGLPPVIGSIIGLDGPFIAKAIGIALVAISTVFSLLDKAEVNPTMIMGFSVLSMIILADVIREEIDN